MDRPVARPPRRVARRVVLAVAGLAAAAGLARAALPHVRRYQAAEASVAASTVRTAEVVVGDVVRDAPAQGRVVAARHPTLYSPASGLVNLVARAGASVKKGDPIATIDSPELKSRLAQERATLEVLRSSAGRQGLAAKEIALREQQAVALDEVKLSAARRLLERASRTFDAGLLTRIDLEKARDDVKIAELELAHARDTARLEGEIASFDLRDKGLQADRQAAVVAELERLVAGLVVAAPFDGLVATVHVADREAVQQSTPIVTVVDQGEHEIEIALADAYASDAVPGTKVEITWEGKALAARLASISPEVRDGQVKGIVRFDEAPPPALKQGQRVSARLVFETRRGVPKLPRGPFVEAGAGRVAYVVENGVATRRTIALGATSVADVEIADGLAVGEKVVISDTAPFARATTVLLNGGGS